MADLALLHSKYLQEISRYCAVAPQQEETTWLHKFVCEVNIADVFVAAFTG